MGERLQYRIQLNIKYWTEIILIENYLRILVNVFSPFVFANWC